MIALRMPGSCGDTVRLRNRTNSTARETFDLFFLFLQRNGVLIWQMDEKMNGSFAVGTRLSDVFLRQMNRPLSNVNYDNDGSVNPFFIKSEKETDRPE